MVSAYYKRLTSTDSDARAEAAKRWALWEHSLIGLLPHPDYIRDANNTDHAQKVARIECHCFQNNGFFKTPNWLIENMNRIRHIPGVIIHGRYDLICPPVFAWKVHQAWPEADFHMIADAGHASTEPGIAKTLVEYTNRYANK